MVRGLLWYPSAMLDRPVTPVHQNDLSHYFGYSNPGLQVAEDGLKEIPFGEYMMERGLVTHSQLCPALQKQNRSPDVRVGDCAAARGYEPIGQVEPLYTIWPGVATVEVA